MVTQERSRMIQATAWKTQSTAWMTQAGGRMTKTTP